MGEPAEWDFTAEGYEMDAHHLPLRGDPRLDHAPVQVCEWQDISTAPLDAELLVSDGRAIAVARVHVIVCEHSAFVSVVYSTASNLCSVRKPTHWMPLPFLPGQPPGGASAGRMHVILPEPEAEGAV